MRMQLLSIIGLLSSFSLAELLTATSAAPDSIVTKAPDIPIELLRKQNNDRYMGWVQISGTWLSRSCDLGGTYFESGDYWRCCATTNDGCNAPIGCITGSLIYSVRNSGTISYITEACTTLYTNSEASLWSMCNTALMFENTADTNPATNVNCGQYPSRWTYFRVRPTESPSTSSSSSSSSTALDSTSTTSTTTQGLGSPSPTPSPPPEKEKSKAWIAGAVVGPVVGLALIGAALWFFLARRKKIPPPPMQQHEQPGIPGPYHPPAPPYYDSTKPTMMPVGVSSHQGWAPPQSPTSQGSHSPQPVHAPYTQQWPPMQGQQMFPGASPPQSPPPHPMPTHGAAGGAKVPGVGYAERPFSAELDSGRGQQQAFR